MFNNTAVFMGDWKAMKNSGLGDKQWKLFNITNDVGENIDLADKHPKLLQTMVTAYDQFAKDVGVIVPDDYGESALVNQIGK